MGSRMRHVGTSQTYATSAFTEKLDGPIKLVFTAVLWGHQQTAGEGNQPTLPTPNHKDARPDSNIDSFYTPRRHSTECASLPSKTRNPAGRHQRKQPLCTVNFK